MRYLLYIILLIGVAVRFVGLGANPVGVVDDEADAAYDAYSIIQTGKDQWGVSFPITSFRGFGDYRLPVYTYLSVLPVAVFGPTPFAIRLPSAIFGSLTILIVYYLIKELFRHFSETLPLLSAFFLAISPWHIGMSRIGLEHTTSVFLVSAGLYALLKGRRMVKWLFSGGVLFALSMYTYTPNILLVPFLLTVTLYLYRTEYRNFRRNILFTLCLFVFLSLPIIFTQGTSTAATRTRQVNFTNDVGIINAVNEKQGSCVALLPRAACRFVFNKYSAFGTKLISNYLNHFSPSFLSVYGTSTQYSILPSRGLLYMLDYGLLVMGFIAALVHPTPGIMLILAFLFFSAVPDSLTSDGQFARFFVSYPAWPILSAFAVMFIAKKFKNFRVPIAVFVAAYCFFFISFFVEYWTFFPYRYSQYSHFGYEELIQKIQEYSNSYDRIVLSSRVNDVKQYIYYLFYARYDPKAFQLGKGIEKVIEPNGWVRVKRINTVEFLPSLPGRDEIVNEHILLIGAPEEFPKYIPKVLPEKSIPHEFTVKDKAGNVLFVGVDSFKLYL